MKRLLLVVLVGFANICASSVDKTIKEAEQLINDIASFSNGIERKIQKKSVTSADLKPDLKKIDSFQAKLKEVKSKIASLKPRAEPNWIEILKDSYNKNLAGLNLDVEDVYPYLQTKLMPTGVQGSILKLSAAQLMDKIKTYRNRFPDDRKMRQMEFFFANDMLKEAFDAYLKGLSALKKLMITNPKQKQKLEDLYPQKFADANAQLADAKQNIENIIK